MEHEGAVGVRDAALVAAVLHAAMHPAQYAARMQQALGDIPVVEGRGEAKHVRVEDALAAHARAEDVAVHADDARHRAAVGVERGGAVVRLRLQREEPFVVELHDARVVVEDAHEPIDLLADLVRRPLHVALEEPIDDAGLAVLVGVFHLCGKDFVLAVLRPGLRDAFELDIGRIRGQAQRRAVRAHLRVGVVCLDRLHLAQFQREHAVAAQGHQRVVGNLQRDLAHHRLAALCHDGQRQERLPFERGHFLTRFHHVLLDERVREEVLRDVLAGLARRAAHGEDRGLVHRLAGREVPAQCVLDALGRAAADVVRHAGAEADLDHEVIVARDGMIQRGDLDDRVGEEFCSYALEFFGRERGVNRVNADHVNVLDVDVQIIAELRAQGLAGRVPLARLHRDFNAARHRSTSRCSAPRHRPAPPCRGSSPSALRGR